MTFGPDKLFLANLSHCVILTFDQATQFLCTAQRLMTMHMHRKFQDILHYALDKLTKHPSPTAMLDSICPVFDKHIKMQ